MLLEWSEVLGIMFNVYQIYLFIEFIYNTWTQLCIHIKDMFFNKL